MDKESVSTILEVLKKAKEALLSKDRYTTSLATAKLKPKAESSKLNYVPQGKNSVGRENMREGSQPNIHTEKPASSIGPNDKLTTGTRITYRNNRPKTGSQIYNDPKTWEKSLPDENYGGLIKTQENGQWSLVEKEETCKGDEPSNEPPIKQLATKVKELL